MTESDLAKRTKEVWRQKSDRELIIASENLSEYTEEAAGIICAELQRRNILEQEPTLRIEEAPQIAQPSNGEITKPSNSKITTGIVLVVIGIALIIISPNLQFTETSRTMSGGFSVVDIRENTQLKNLAFYGGIFFLVVGGISAAIGFGKFNSDQPTSSSPTEPSSKSVSPKSIEIGNSPDEVQAVMGTPNKIINLGVRVIHVYEDMKITYVEDKVSDVQLS